MGTLKLKRDFGDDDENSDAWQFSIGWNRKIDPETGLPMNEPTDQRFLSNRISTAKYTCLNFVPYNLLH